MDNLLQDNTDAISSLMPLSSSALGAKGGVKRGKPEPLTLNRSPEKKNDNDSSEEESKSNAKFSFDCKESMQTVDACTLENTIQREKNTKTNGDVQSR